jgi:hypothetical protein
MATRMWVLGCFRCELQDGPVPRLCLYHQEALLRAVICARDTAARESEEMRRFVEDPLVASRMAVRGGR